jgi:hypothetical protein
MPKKRAKPAEPAEPEEEAAVHVVGQVFGKWRITRLYKHHGEAWAEIATSRGVRNRERVIDLPLLEGSA